MRENNTAVIGGYNRKMLAHGTPVHREYSYILCMDKLHSYPLTPPRKREGVMASPSLCLSVEK